MNQDLSIHKKCELEDSLRIVEDIIDLFDSLDTETQRKAAFLLTTEYRHVLFSYFGGLVKSNPILHGVIKEVLSCTYSYMTICQFNEYQAPVYQMSHQLFSSALTSKERALLSDRMCKFQEDILLLNRARLTNDPCYDEKREEFASQYLDFLSYEPHVWLIDWFSLDKINEPWKRERKFESES